MPKPKQILCIALSTLFIFVGLSPAYAITPKPRKINTGKAKVQKSGVERKTKLGDVRRNRSVAGRNITRSAQAGRNASRQAAVSTATRSTTHVAPQIIHFQTIGTQTGQVAGHAPTQAQLQAQVQARIEADMSNQIRNSAKNSRGKNGVVQPTPASKKVTQTPAKNTAQPVTPTPAPKEPTPTPQPAAQPSTPQQPVVAQSSARPGNLYGGFGFVFDWLKKRDAKKEAKASLESAQSYGEANPEMWEKEAQKAFQKAQEGGLKGEDLKPYQEEFERASQARAKAEAKAKAKAEAEAKAKAEAEAKAKAEAKVNAQQNLADAQNYLENNSLNSALSSSQNALSYAQKAGLTGEELAPYEQTLAKAKEAHAQAQARAKALQLAQAKGAPLNLTNKVERAVFNTLQESRETQITAMQKMNNWLQAILRNNKNTSRSFPFLLDFARREGVVSWEEYELLTGWETPHSTISFYVWKISFYSWNTIYDSINKLLTWVQEEKQFWHDARINYQNPNQTALVETTRTALSELSTRLQEELRHLEGLVIRYHNQPTESLLEKIESLQEQIKQKAAQLEQLTQKVNTIYGNELSAEISQTQEVLQEATRVSQIQNLQTQLEMGEQFDIHLTENAGEKPQARRLNPRNLTPQEQQLYNKVQTASAQLANWKKMHRGKTPSWDSTDPVEKALYNLISHVLSDAEKAGWGDTTLVQKLRKQSGLRKWSSSQQLLEEYKRFRVQNPHRNPNSNDPAEAKLHMAMKNQLNIHRAELETNPLFREMNRLWNTVPLEGEELIHLQAEVYAREAVNDPVVLEAEEMWQKFLKRQQRGQ
ncbi:MAG: hypothetical protein J6X06_00905 [Elusimicrobiaceae bacterium]|nr:hypothetical protein [Elusimicrobiaceae bacterium]